MSFFLYAPVRSCPVAPCVRASLLAFAAGWVWALACLAPPYALAQEAAPDTHSQAAPDVQNPAAPEVHGVAGSEVPNPAAPDAHHEAGPDVVNQAEAGVPNPAGAEVHSPAALRAHTLPVVTVLGEVVEEAPTVPVSTPFAAQFHSVGEGQIARQNAVDFYEALRNVPGLMFQKRNLVGGQTSHSLYVRGRGANHPGPDVQVLFDEVPRSGALFGQVLADAFPVYALGGMEIYKYPQPSRFGSGYAMVNFLPKYRRTPGSEFRLGAQGGSFGTFAENIGAGTRQGPFDIYAAHSYVRTDGHVRHSAARQTSYYLNAGYEVLPQWSLRLMANHVDAYTEAPDNPLTREPMFPSRYDTRTSLASLTLSHAHERASGFLKAYFNDTRFSLVEESAGEGVGNAMSRQYNKLFGVRVRETLRLWAGSEAVAGADVDFMHLQNRQTRHDGGENRVWKYPRVAAFSPFLALSHRFGDKHHLHFVPSLGLRLHLNNTFANALSPQAGAIVGFADSALLLNYARGVNYPSPVVLHGFLADARLPEGFNTQKIKPEVVDHVEVGLSHAFKGLASLGANFFYDSGKDRLRAYMGGAAPSEAYFNSRVARYKVRGLELWGSLSPTAHTELFAGATWLRAKAAGEDGVQRRAMPYTPSFALQAGFRWRFVEQLQLSGDYQYMRGLYAATSMRTVDNYAPLGALHKLPNPNLLNLRLDFLFHFAPLLIEEAKIFLAVNNVLDSTYAYAKQVSGDRSANYVMPGIHFMAGMEVKF